jgi:hypothetical protein
MIAMSVSDEEDAVVSALEKGGEGVAQNVLVTSSLTELITDAGFDVSLQTSALSRVLSKLGWVKVPRQMKWRGRVCRVWVKGMAVQDSDAYRTTLRKLLDETLVTSGFDDQNLDLFA